MRLVLLEPEYGPLSLRIVVMNKVIWHQHTCPQCFVVWVCGKADCNPTHQRFCPYGELCHIKPDGSWKVEPDTIRKGRGVGELFKTCGIRVVSPHKEGHQGL